MQEAFAQLRAALKYLLSFRKDGWDLADYPLRFREQRSDNDPEGSIGRRELPRWSVQVINWWQLGGLGDTREAAMAMLRDNFEKAKAERPLPRPGTRVPIEFAACHQIDSRGEALEDFARRVLGFEPGTYFISDQSSLWDFTAEDTLNALHAKIAQVYGVDVSDLPDALIWKVLDRIASKSL